MLHQTNKTFLMQKCGLKVMLKRFYFKMVPFNQTTEPHWNKYSNFLRYIINTSSSTVSFQRVSTGKAKPAVYKPLTAIINYKPLA